MPTGWPVDERGKAVKGSIACAVGQHPPAWSWEPLWNIFARDLAEVFPQVLRDLLDDSSFSMCGMMVPRRPLAAGAQDGGTKRLGPYRHSDTTVEIQGRVRALPRAYRRNSGARGITAAWADLDYYRLGLSDEHVVGALHGMQQRGELPPVSLLLFSGRGIWTIWVLRDQDDPNRAVRAGAANLRVWGRLQHAIQAKLACLGADAAAIDVARMARVPGSQRNDLDEEDPVPIGWQVQGPPGRTRPFTYGLAELAQCFGVVANAPSQTVETVLDEVPAHVRLAKQRGARGRFFKLLQQLDALEQMRGGWRIGTRGRALWLQVAAMVSVRRWCRRIRDTESQPPEMRRIGHLTDDEILRWIREVAERCELGEGFNASTEAASAWRRALADGGLGSKRTGGKPLRNQTISNWLGVTPAESELLRDRGFNNPLPPATSFGPGTSSSLELCRPAREAAAHSRRACIRELEAERARSGKPWPALRGLRCLLAQHGHRGSPRTISKDLKLLGIDNPYSRDALHRERDERSRQNSLPYGAA
jgi:hypothetical protein